MRFNKGIDMNQKRSLFFFNFGSKLIYKLTLSIAISVITMSLAIAKTDCSYAASQTQMNKCAKRNFAQTERELNKAYKQALAGLSKSDGKKLQLDQRDWIKQRKTKCRSRAGHAPRKSMQPSVYYNCMEDVASKRIYKLRHWNAQQL